MRPVRPVGIGQRAGFELPQKLLVAQPGGFGFGSGRFRAHRWELPDWLARAQGEMSLSSDGMVLLSDRTILSRDGMILHRDRIILLPDRTILQADKMPPSPL
jgi:hypothetical protein